MKQILFFFILLTGIQFLHSQDEVNVKFYLDDGSTKQYNISEIDNISVISGQAGYMMQIYYQESPPVSYSTDEIESILFESDGDSRLLSIYISGNPESYDINEIDSINFVILEVPAPVITEIDPVSGIIGDEIIISGTDFGDTQGSGIVAFTGADAAEYTSWTDTEILVIVPEGALSGKVSVTADNGKISNEVDFTVLVAEEFQIISITPKASKIGDEVTIKGTVFGSSRDNSFVSFNGTDAIEYTSWSDSEIKVIMPIGAKTGKVSVNVNDEKSNELDFSIIPHITSITPSYAGLTEIITISGTGFGDSLGTGTVSFYRADAEEYTAWNDTTIQVEIPEEAESGKLYVTASGNKSNELDFSVIQHIISISPIAAKIGDEVTIEGTNFTKHEGKVSFNGMDVSDFEDWSDTEIKLVVPLGTKNGKVSVIIDTMRSNEVDFSIIPQLTSISPTSSITGELITIEGTGFGDSLSSNRVIFKGEYKTRYDKWTDTEIKIKVPPDAETGKISVKVGQQTSNGLDFVVLPTITNISPVTAQIGDKITITGTGFCSSRGSSVVSFNGAEGSIYVYWSNRAIEVNVPGGAKTGKVSVTVGGNKSNEEDITIIVAPAITGISPDSAGIGDQVTITGTNFGNTRGSSFVKFGSKNVTSYTSWSSTQIRVKVPSGATSCKVSVTVNSIKSNEVDFEIGSAAGDYDEVTIGNQTWMLKNLDVTHYRNGDEIPQVTDATEWANLTTGAWCYYNNSSANGTTYGKLYNWYAVNDSRGLAPEGWHIPTDDEWKTLEMYLGMSQAQADRTAWRGTDQGSQLAGRADLWNAGPLENNANFGTSGFSALPGGCRYDSGTFNEIGSYGNWWSSSETGLPTRAWRHRVGYDEARVWRNSSLKENGYSVRCVKD